MSTKLLIIGAGVVGLAAAYIARSAGLSVTVLERHPLACGASVRNFGMLWPIGQPTGPLHDLAIRSRALWQHAAETTGLWLNPCGSLHLAHHEDEQAVLEEFIAQSPARSLSLLTADQVREITPAAASRLGPARLRAGLHSTTEAAVNPRTASAHLAQWLAAQPNVSIQFNALVREVSDSHAITARGERHDFDFCLICGGADITTLYPDFLSTHTLRLCKLHMLATPPNQAPRIGPHLASGLTLRHYRNFEICKSHAALRRRIATQTPELDRYGIHVMASQDDAGRIILGDSHEYDHNITPFDNALIDELMLRELQLVFNLPSWDIAQRWHGIYAKHPSLAYVHAPQSPRVHALTGLGGAGMTLSFGAAEQTLLNAGIIGEVFGL